MEISIIPTKRTNCLYSLMQKCTRAWTKLEEIRHIHFEIFVIPAKFYKNFKLTLFSFFKVMIILSSYILYSSSNLLGCTVFSTIIGWWNLSCESDFHIALVNSLHTGRGAAPGVRALQQSQDVNLIPSLTNSHFPASCS